MRKLARRLRERVRAFAAATFRRRPTDREGVTLSLQDVTPRMRYQLCHDYEAETDPTRTQPGAPPPRAGVRPPVAPCARA